MHKDGPCPLEGLGVDGDVDQRIEPTDGANVARFGPFNTQVLGLAIDALTARPLGIDGLVERTVAIQQGTYKPTGFQIDVLDAAFTTTPKIEAMLPIRLDNSGVPQNQEEHHYSKCMHLDVYLSEDQR